MMNAIHFLHSNNFVHRDIKPDNLLVGSDLNLKLADFGMAGFEADLEKKNFATCCGTEQYMAPEIFSWVLEQKNTFFEGYKGKPVDIFSAGVVLFMMSLGACPFARAVPTDPQFSYMASGEWVKYWNMLEKGMEVTVSENLRSIIQGMLEPNPEKRLSSQEIA